MSQQGVYAPATFVFFSFVVADCLSVWLVVPALHVSDSVLACLTFRISPIVSKLMLQSESIASCCRCISLSAAMISLAGGFWSTVGLLVLTVFPGAGCCSVAFFLKSCISKLCSAFHNTTQHSSAQHNTTQHNTTQHNTTQHNTTQHNTTQHNTTQHNTTPLGHLTSRLKCQTKIPKCSKALMKVLMFAADAL